MTVTHIDPKTGLVVIDLQHGILAQPTVPNTPEQVVSRTAKLAEAIRARGGPVVLVRVSTAADGSDAAPGRTEVSLGNAAQRPANWDVIVPELSGHPEDLRITKRNWGAFYGTDLDLQLRRRGITQIVLAGVATSLGVESTARCAHEHGYHVTLAIDAMADRSEEAHRNSLERIFPRLGQTGTTAQIIEFLTGPGQIRQ
jgi:nicotinamidase-related amidase